MMVDFLNEVKVLIGITVIYLVFAAGLLPLYAQKMNQAARKQNPAVEKAALKPLDLRSKYTKTEVNAFFEAIGPEGKKHYHFIEAKIDMAYPIVYTLFFMSFIAFLLAKNKWDKGILQSLLLVPLLASIPDYFENFNILRMMELGASDALAIKGSLYSTTKWAGVLLSLLTILVLASRLALIKFNKR